MPHSKLDPSIFLHKLFDALAKAGIQVTDLELDHVCYRVESMERYEAMRKELETVSALLGVHIIGGRPIATYRLHEPFVFGERLIDVVELPAPKSRSHYPEGFEHAEFVVEVDLLAFTRRYSDLPWDLRGSSKPHNAEVRLVFDGFSVKFHRLPLAEVIEQERRLNASGA